MRSVWDLIEAGDFVEACLVADKEAAESTSVLPLRNKVLALLCLERHQDAANLCEEIIRRQHGNSDNDFIFLGISHWFLGQREQAIETWKSAKHTTYTDAAGGVEIHLLLFYAGVRCKDDLLRKQAEQQLRDHLRTPSMRAWAANWPGPIAQFLLNDLGEKQMLEKMSSQPLMRAKQVCQAAFFTGVVRLFHGDENGFLACMQEATSQGPISRLKHEFYLASAELEICRVAKNHM